MKSIFKKMIIALLAIAWGTLSVYAQNVNMNRYIVLNVKEGADILLDICADADNTSIKIVSGNNERIITVGTKWVGRQNYSAGAGTMTIYGNVQQFDCGGNAANITGLNASNNTQLQELYCYLNSIASIDIKSNTQLKGLGCFSNSLTSIDVSNNTQLKLLDCSANSISSIDVSHNPQLEQLWIFDNSLTSLDLSNNTKLTRLNCCNNSLTSIDVSHNPQLEWLYCFENSLATLDISRNKNLNYLACYGNRFSTAVLDDIYCSLPDRKDKSSGVIRPLLNEQSSEKDKVLATNGSNVISKNWKVKYYAVNSDITGFTGMHQCGGTGVEEVKDTPAVLSVYPNPVSDILYITADKPAHSIRVYNVYGQEVAQATDADSINVANLPAGVYIVNADGKIVRIIKE